MTNPEEQAGEYRDEALAVRRLARSRTLGRVVDPLRKLAVVASAKCDGNDDEMLRIRLHSAHALLTSDPLIADMRDIWKNEIARPGAGFVRLVDTISGFEVRFSLMDECGEMVTGLISVDLTPGLA